MKSTLCHILRLLALAALLFTAPASPAQTFRLLFADNPGEHPSKSLVQGSDGNLYGTTAGGGASNYGTVFKVTPAGALTTLVYFNVSNGSNPAGELVKGSDGSFYGTTTDGGVSNYGTVFMVTPAGVLTKLHSFDGTTAATPMSAMVFGTAGNPYGTAGRMAIWSISLGSATTVTTGSASGVLVSTASVAGTVIANGTDTTITFEYGVSTAYGRTVAATPSSVAGSRATAVRADLTGLQPETKYHFRAVAINSEGITQGADATFLLAAAAANDTFAKAQILSGVAGSVTGTDENAGMEAGESNPVALRLAMPANLPGKYTVIFAAKTPAGQGRPASEFPQGDGYGLVTVASNGVVKLAGTLAEGTEVSFADALSKKQTWPIYIPLAGGAGSLSGAATLRAHPDISDLDGLDLHWFKPAGKKLYPSGWPDAGIRTDLLGAKLVIPAALEPRSVFPGLGLTAPAGNATLTFTDGNTPAGGLVKIDIRNKVGVVANNADRLEVTISPAIGRFTGQFIHPVSKKMVTFQGAILQT